MDVQVADTGPCQRTLTITIPPERIKSQLDQSFRAAAKQVQLKGFRPGKVPRRVLEQRFGEAIRMQAKEDLVSRSYEEACRANELEVVGNPSVEGLADGPLDSDLPLEFQVRVEVRPPIELGEVEGLEIEARSTEVTDQDIEDALKQLAGQKRTLSAVEEPVADGDFVKVAISYRDEGGAEVLRKEEVQLNVNIPIAGVDAEAFKAKLVGAEPGHEAELELTFPATFEVAAVRDKSGSARLTLKQVLRVQAAPIDDDLAKSFDFESLEAMRTELTSRIGTEKVRNEQSRQELALLDLIANEHPFPLPQAMVDRQTKASLADFERRLKEAKTPDEEIAKRLEEAGPEAAQDAERRVRMFFLLDAIARKHEIKVSTADLRAELHTIAAQHQAPLADVEEHFRKHDMMGELGVGVMERKVREFLRANARITDTKG